MAAVRATGGMRFVCVRLASGAASGRRRDVSAHQRGETSHAGLRSLRQPDSFRFLAVPRGISIVAYPREIQLAHRQSTRVRLLIDSARWNSCAR